MSALAATPPTLPEPLKITPIRHDLIETAVKFLKDPQVQSASLSKRLAFLEKKGLTAEEIELALLKASGSNGNSLESSKDIRGANCKPCRLNYI